AAPVSSTSPTRRSSDLSWGATGRNGGFLTGGGALSYRSAIDSFGRDAARAIWTVSADGRALAQDVIGREEIDCDFRMPGIMSLRSEEHTSELQSRENLV